MAPLLVMPVPSSSTRRDELARGYTLAHRVLNFAGIALFSALSTLALARIIALGRDPSVPAWPCIALAAMLLALPAADFFSGLVHWAADNWGSGSWPIVGGFVQPFRNHHVDPEDMTRHDLLERNGDNSIASMPVFWWATLAEGSPAWVLFWESFWLATAFWVLATNQFHAWAHMKRAPRLARWLQRKRLILSPDHHATHHRSPYACNYCITTGWLNRPLQRLGVFAALEHVLTRLTGVEPLHKQRCAISAADAPGVHQPDRARSM